ncbi:MAG: helix-turn-helix domain-containing protein [Chloroflexi bacterium]|nr:helix-turn-helix domain-containing protein [Chloroflexota bacterium]
MAGGDFRTWLSASMHNRGLSQAQLARSVGVADTQVSRWRRGQVVPTVQYLQRLADTFGVERAVLDRMVGLPVAEAREGGSEPQDPQVEAELQAYQARLREVLEQRLPRSMWRAYMEACVALAEGLGGSARRIMRESLEHPAHELPPIGFPQTQSHTQTHTQSQTHVRTDTETQPNSKPAKEP